MARQLRLEYEGAPYHVTARGTGGRSSILMTLTGVNFSTSWGTKSSNSIGGATPIACWAMTLISCSKPLKGT